MTLQDLINLAQERDLSKSYPKADGLYIWDYKLQYNEDFTLDLVLIPSDSSKAGFKDKVSVQEILDYVLDEYNPEIVVPHLFGEIKIIEVEGITIAKV
ncbi:hypothetical protein UFOVP54_185 [uncultured Caudovirales phage]|uniref:Uncharacterized protein n=1 Tax=uncultured Caudovirales phage TaxID=2100421 RepID=A0A6J5KUG7_9CAUD|nr:hypothetical protein UFOVP54_185 [uncultured Caudovirales phage]